MPHQAFITITVKGWTGWSRQQPDPASRRLAIRPGHKLTPAVVGIPSDDYEITVISVTTMQIGISYSGVVVENSDGSINLTAPCTGVYTLTTGQCLRLATATMDGGTLLSLTLDRIE